MKNKWFVICSIILIVLCLLTVQAGAITVERQKMIIDVPRILHGTKNGYEFFGPDRGRITLPHDKGSVFYFSLFNDMRLNSFAVTNKINFQIGSYKVSIPHYTTRNQIFQQYKEFPGQWAAAGIYVYSLSIPEGYSYFTFDNKGSQTGIALGIGGLAPGRVQFTNWYIRETARGFGNPLVEASRRLTGAKTGKFYYGYTGGTIHLPHDQGGYLTFDVYNDQRISVSSFLNFFHIGAHGFKQYTTTMDLKEEYKEFPGQWGPAGGSKVILHVLKGVKKVSFNHKGSQSGIEIADVEFNKPRSLFFEVKEKVNFSKNVLRVFTRELHGASSGRSFYGYTGGKVILPHNKGGKLKFFLWNDHRKGVPETKNVLTVNNGTEHKIPYTTVEKQRHEFYKEYPDQWGPAGGKEITIPVPSGVGEVTFSNHGSQSGIELNGFYFVSDPCLPYSF